MATTGLRQVRAWATATAEAAPTAASAFVNLNDLGGQHFKKMKLLAGAPTFTGSPTSVLLQVWYKVGDVIVAGPQITVTAADGAMAEKNLGVVPGDAVYATVVSFTGGSSPDLTMALYALRYNDDDAAV